MATPRQLRVPDAKTTATIRCALVVVQLALMWSMATDAIAEEHSSPVCSTNVSHDPMPAAKAAMVRSCPDAPLIMAQTVSYLASGVSTNRLSQETLRSPAVQMLRKELTPLRALGKLDDPNSVAGATARATTQAIHGETRAIEVPGPEGAKVLAVYKKPGEIVHRGEKIALVELNGRQFPITSKVDGVMQDINISKGGILGNKLHSSAQRDRHSVVRIALISPFIER